MGKRYLSTKIPKQKISYLNYNIFHQIYILFPLSVAGNISFFFLDRKINSRHTRRKILFGTKGGAHMATRRFDLYRYQIIPAQKQLNLLYNMDEVIQKKNLYFENALLETKNVNNRNKFTIEKRGNNSFTGTILRKKAVKLYTENGEEKHETSYPPIHIIIDNEPQWQIIAIERTPEYPKTTGLINKIAKSIDRILAKHNLIVKPSALSRNDKFWDYIENNKDDIQNISFTLITPNMSNISAKLSEQIKQNAKKTKASETNFSIKAEKGASLLIDRENELIGSMIEYISDGGGSASITARGVSAKFKTDDYQLSIAINELQFKDLSTVLERIRRKVHGEKK